MFNLDSGYRFLIDNCINYGNVASGGGIVGSSSADNADTGWRKCPFYRWLY